MLSGTNFGVLELPVTQTAMAHTSNRHTHKFLSTSIFVHWCVLLCVHSIHQFTPTASHNIDLWQTRWGWDVGYFSRNFRTKLHVVLDRWISRSMWRGWQNQTTLTSLPNLPKCRAYPSSTCSSYTVASTGL